MTRSPTRPAASPVTLETPRVWGGGQLLAFSGLDGPTDYAAGLCARTALEGTGVELLLPGRVTVRMASAPPTAAALTGDAFLFETTGGQVRGAFLDAHHLLIDGPCEPVPPADGLAVLQRGGRTLIGAAARFDASRIEADLDAARTERQGWLNGFRIDGRLPEPRRRAIAKALSIMKTQVCTAEGRIRRTWTTPDRWPHRAMWLWDSAFHAIGWRHADPALARSMLEAVLDAQQPDGRIPITVSPSSFHTLTQPPVLALAAWLVHETDPAGGWIESLYPKLAAYVAWDLAHRDTDGQGLVEWFIVEDPVCRSGESGMDNCSRFDVAKPLDAVDFNAFLATEAEILARIADRRGEPQEAARWRQEQARLNRLMNDRLWDNAQGLYLDAFAGTDCRTGIPSCASFLPLLSGAPDTRQAARLLEALQDPARFATPVPVPSVPPSAGPGLYDRDMWRGPMWVNMNWLIARGLDRYGFAEQAQTLRRKTVDTVDAWYSKTGLFYEFYDDAGAEAPHELPRKKRVGTVVRDYGWTATLYLDLALHLAGTGLVR